MVGDGGLEPAAVVYQLDDARGDPLRGIPAFSTDSSSRRIRRSRNQADQILRRASSTAISP
jgi:hypothetical protein